MCSSDCLCVIKNRKNRNVVTSKNRNVYHVRNLKQNKTSLRQRQKKASFAHLQIDVSVIVFYKDFNVSKFLALV